MDFKCNYEKFERPKSSYEHKLLLINAATYINKLVTKEPELTTAFEFAAEDSEWLLIPLDSMKDGIGFQSRIPVADFWTVEHFKHLKKLTQ